MKELKKKKWIDANEIAEYMPDIDEELWQYETLMKEKPNFDKSPGARKVFQRKEYSIYRAKQGYIIHNTNKRFEEGHSHVASFKKAKSLIDLAMRKKLPNTPRKWELESLMRITNNNTYYNKLRDLYESLDK